MLVLIPSIFYPKYTGGRTKREGVVFHISWSQVFILNERRTKRGERTKRGSTVCVLLQLQPISKRILIFKEGRILLSPCLEKERLFNFVSYLQRIVFTIWSDRQEITRIIFCLAL